MKTDELDLFGQPPEPSVGEFRRAYRLCHLKQPLDHVLADPIGRLLLRNVARFTLHSQEPRRCSPHS